MITNDLPVSYMSEGGYVVRGTQDELRARAEVYAYRRHAEGHDSYCAGWALDIPLHRIGLFRWTPCNENSCWDGGGHSGHIQYCDKPGRGVFKAVYFQS